MLSNAKYPLRTKKASYANINYTAIRFEGETGTSGTPGSSTCVYECYLFSNNVIELNFGNWNSFISGAANCGLYAANGTVLATYSSAASTGYVFTPNATATSYTVNQSNSYITGAIVARQALEGGNSAAASWPPTGWTSIQNVSADDAFLTQTLQYNILFNNVSRNTAYIGSNMYITFGAGSTVYSTLSSTNPPYDKIMMNSGDRSYQRVAYKYGSK